MFLLELPPFFLLVSNLLIISESSLSWGVGVTFSSLDLLSEDLESVGPQIWNCLPNKMKSAENLKNFKLMIKQWSGPECKCSACHSFTLTDQ